MEGEYLIDFSSCREPTQHLVDKYALKFKDKTGKINKKWTKFKETLRPHTLAALEKAKNKIKSIQTDANISKGAG